MRGGTVKVRLALIFSLSLIVPAIGGAQTPSARAVIVEDTPVRIDPTARVPLTTLSRGTDVEIVSVKDGWYLIAFEDQRYARRVGYVPQSVLSVPGGPQAASSKTASDTVRPPVSSVATAFPAAAASSSSSAPVRPAVSSVAADFPAAAPSSSAASVEKPRTVVSIGDAFAGPGDTGTVVVPSTVASTAMVSRAPASDSATRVTRSPVSPKRGMPVTLMIPRSLLKDDTDRASRTMTAVVADVAGAGGATASINGVTDWMRTGLPSLLQGTVKSSTRKGGYTALELQATSARGADMIVTLRFADSVSNPEATLGQLLVEGGPDSPAALTYRKEAYAAVGDAVFANDLEGLAAERKLSILSTLQSAPGAPDVHVHEGYVYASFDLGVDARIFDDRSADAASIAAYVLNGTMLPEARKLAKSLAAVPELRGMRVTYRIPHQATPRASANEYQLELIADMHSALAFAGGELTDSAFMDGAVLLVNGRPVRVSLGTVTQSARR